MDKRLYLELDTEEDRPVYLQIRDQLRQRILQGDLPIGTQLPPERKLAQTLGISRTTVVNAYDELEAEGLVEGHVGRGTLVIGQDVAEAQPIPWPAHLSSIGQRLAQHAQTAELLTLRQMSARPGVISLALGMPDLSLLPPERLHRAWDAVLGRLGTAAVGSCPVRGLPEMRGMIADRMRRRGVTIDPEEVVVVNGSQHGLDLLLRLLVKPGDAVMVETPTYFGALQSFLAGGVRIIGVPVDGRGMDIGQAAFLLARYRPRFIYTVPTYQNPTGATMSLERREQLLALAQEHQVPIVEGDPFGDLYFYEPPPPPIKALDQRGHVLYLGTFSKTLAPGLRVGWLAAPAPVVEQAGLLNRVTELQPNTIGQHLVVEFARQGWVAEQIQRARVTYRTRCETMEAALRRHRLSGLRWTSPDGGMFLWLQLPESVDAQELLAEAGERGVVFLPGSLMYPTGGPRNLCRLSFSVTQEEEIQKGIGTIAAALRTLLRRPARVEKLTSGPIV